MSAGNRRLSAGGRVQRGAPLRFTFNGRSFEGLAGDTLASALLANGGELPQAASEALCYLDRCLGNGFRPGMGHAIPDRLFWAQTDPDPDISENPSDQPPATPSHEPTSKPRP